MRQQEADGDWPQQHISGVFNRNCMITYANYRFAGQAYTPADGNAEHYSVRCVYPYAPLWTAT